MSDQISTCMTSRLEQCGREPRQRGRDQHGGEHRLVVVVGDAREDRPAGEVAGDDGGDERGERGRGGSASVPPRTSAAPPSSAKPMNVTVSVSRVCTGVAPRASA